MIKQLRPAYTESQLLRIYEHQFDHTRWPDHVERVRRTIEILDSFALQVGAETVADLSCGDGAIVKGSKHPWRAVWMSDLTTFGPIEQTLLTIPEVDMFVCSETLEHLREPDVTLYGIRCQARNLLLSTPVGESDTGNPEHVWGWDEAGVSELLEATGWSRRSYVLFKPGNHYTFQIWTCSR